MPNILRSTCSQYDNIQLPHLDFQNGDELEHMPLIDMPNTSINNEVNQVNLKIEGIENELSNMVDKSTNIYLVRAETLNLLMKYRERLHKKLDEIEGIKKKARG
jgi:hypothetical protein